MKCPNCNGTGKEYSFYDGAESVWKDAICPTCNGTGEVWQTNEEYLHLLNTEQLAEFLCNVGFENETIVRKFKSEWVEWLKQPHHEKSFEIKRFSNDKTTHGFTRYFLTSKTSI